MLDSRRSASTNSSASVGNRQNRNVYWNSRPSENTLKLAGRLFNGERAALSKAITLGNESVDPCSVVTPFADGMMLQFQSNPRE